MLIKTAHDSHKTIRNVVYRIHDNYYIMSAFIVHLRFFEPKNQKNCSEDICVNLYYLIANFYTVTGTSVNA